MCANRNGMSLSPLGKAVVTVARQSNVIWLSENSDDSNNNHRILAWKENVPLTD